MGTQMINIKVYCLLSLAVLGMGNSVGKWIEGIPNDHLWTPLSNMALCMYGYDPFEMDRFTKGKTDTGVKKRIFEPTKFTKERGLIPNDFFDYVNDIHCDAHETTTVVDNIRDFMSATSGSNTLFESGSSKISRKVSIIPFFIDYQESKSSFYSTHVKSDYEKQKEYFENHNGDVFINKAKCLVLRVSINKYAKAEFTESFKGALRQLQIAAKNPHDVRSKEERKRFIQEYGTHFLDKCFMGASLTTVTRMSKKSKSKANQDRRIKCVSTAYKEELLSNSGWLFESEKNFETRSNQCDESQSEVLSIGPLPSTDQDLWIKETKLNPSPVDFRLASMTDLFSTNNLEDIPLDPDDEEGEKLDADLLTAFHEGKIEQYCDLMLGAPCQPTKGCHVWNDCDVEERCVDDDSEKGFACKRKEREIHLDIPVSWREDNEICDLDEDLNRFNCIPQGR